MVTRKVLDQKPQELELKERCLVQELSSTTERDHLDHLDFLA
jgi:hypothetical protein